MNETKPTSIVMAVWNQLGYTKLTVRSILENTLTPFELVIIDNGSRPDVMEFFDSLKGSADIRYIRNEKNLGPIRALNQGISSSTYDYICAIHNDVVIFEKDWLGKIISVMEGDLKIGMAGLAGRKEIYRNGCVNEASLMHNLQNEDLNEPMKDQTSDVAVLDGLCLVMRRGMLDKVAGFDETYGYMHCYDLDMSLQSIRAGFKNVVVRIEAMHIGNGGRTRRTPEYRALVKDDYGLLKKNCRIFSKKWADMLPLKV
jgi:GT2 family glycosyltransferase